MDEDFKPPPIVRPPAYGEGCDDVVFPSQLEGRDIPERKWLVDQLIPAGTVTLFTGDGGVGKSLLMQQLCVATALGQDWLGLKTTPCFSFALFCEDTDEELHRRQADICNGLTVPLSRPANMAWRSGVGHDNVLMTFDQQTGAGTLTDNFHRLMDLCQNLQPGLVIIDTLADTFGGNEIIRNQVRTFINGCLGLICKEIGATVILCGHPSQSGLSSGSGYSGSTAWNNSVRARLYLMEPDDEDAEPTERILSTKKSNYGPSGDAMELHWSNGMFKPVEKLTGMVGHIEKNNHEQTFLKCLDALAKRGGSGVSDSKNSPTYAPKIMAKMPERERVKRNELEKAMFSLFSKGDIVNQPYGPPSRLFHRIARKPVEGGNDDE